MCHIRAFALFAAASMLAVPGVAFADPLGRAGEAVAELNRAIDAISNSNDRFSAASLSWESEGRLLWQDQGPRPGQPMEITLRLRQHVDPDPGLAYLAMDLTTPESSFTRSAVVRTGTDSADLLGLLGQSPVTVLRHFAARPRDLRLRTRADAGAVIVGPLGGSLVELEIGADSLPQALTYVIGDDLLGDGVRRIEYLDYRERDGWIWPSRVRQFDAGRLIRDVTVVAFAAGGERPAWTAGMEPRQVNPEQSPANFAVEQIAPGIYHLKNIGNSDYHGLAVELAEGWMVLETPRAIGDATELRQALSAISPKPVVYAAATHHHDDHAAGMAAFRDRAVTVLSSAGNAEYFTTMMQASRNFSLPSSPAQVVALSPIERMGPVQFLTVNASPHAGEMLLFYFPEHRILFQSDLARFNHDGSVEPARAHTCALRAAIERHGLAVDRIYSGHGRPGAIDDLRQSIALRDTPCP